MANLMIVVVKMKIKLNNKFYTKEAIDAAINAFRNVCICKLIDDSFELELNISENLEEPIAEEFCNFVLGTVKEKLTF